MSIAEYGISASGSAWWRDCDDSDESLLSALARHLNGGRVTSAPCREQVVVELLEVRPRWSDRRVAELCSVSPKTVSRLRSPEARGSADGLTKRVGRDGRRRPVDPTAVRETIMEAIRRRPDASLRSIAAEVDVSPETVRSVRRRMAVSGESERPRAVRNDDVVALWGQRGEHLPTRSPSRVPLPRPWTEGHAFRATTRGADFLEWMDTTDVNGPAWEWVHEVPLNRVYEISDEAARRAAWWKAFAEQLESRTRRTAW